MTQEFLLYGLTASSAGCAIVAAAPAIARWWARIAGRLERFQIVKSEKAARLLDELFLDVKPMWLKAAYGVGPIVVGLLLFLVSNHLLVALAGVAVAMLLPDALVKGAAAARARRFQAQLVETLFILSSSLRAGLSLTQAFEQLESELGAPASQEFGLMMKAHRLGRTLEDSLSGLNQRMPSTDLTLITTAVVVARETGGDVTKILSQLIATVRERRKLQDKVRTLTLQGRLQAYIMSALPVLFAFFVRTFNTEHFKVLLEDPMGNRILVLAVGLWLVGMALLLRLSRVEI